jgi:hypothetical protein
MDDTANLEGERKRNVLCVPMTMQILRKKEERRCIDNDDVVDIETCNLIARLVIFPTGFSESLIG